MGAEPSSSRSEPHRKVPERRRTPRARADWPISLSLPDGRFEARVRDVSGSGVCFFLDRPVPAMTVLSIDLELPVEGGLRYLTARGVVVRCERISERLDHYEIAVFLNEIAEPDRAALVAFAGG